MKYTYLILWLPIFFSCCNNTNNQEQSNKIKDLEERIQQLERIKYGDQYTKPGSLTHAEEVFGGEVTKEGEFFIDTYGDKYKWNESISDYEWVHDGYQYTKPDSLAHADEKLGAGTTKKEESLSEVQDQIKEREGRYKNRSKFPLVRKVIAQKCAWCNVEFEQIEAFKHPISRSWHSDIYRLKDDQSELNHLEYVYELMQKGDEDEAIVEWAIYSYMYDSNFYCSPKCANHQ